MAFMAPGAAFAQGSASVATDASAQILDPAGVTLSSPMSLASTARPNGAAVQVASTPGVVTVNGPASQIFYVESPQTIRLSSASGPSNLVARVSPSAAGMATDMKSRAVTMSSALSVPGSAPPGDYTGQMMVIVDLN